MRDRAKRFSLKYDGYKETFKVKYILENSELTVQFDTFGGQLTSIKDKSGVEYLWQGNPQYWGGQAPVLFPIVGSLREKQAVIGGNKTCCMERHGVVRKLEFEMAEKTDDSITFSISSNAETLQRYPYAFQLKIRYLLSGRNVTTEYTVLNQSGEVMPYQIGGHPGFTCPLMDGEAFEDYVVEFEQEETSDCPSFVPTNGLVDVSAHTRMLDHSKTLKMSHSLFYSDALIFDQLKSRKATLYHPATGRGVQVSFADFDYLLIWSSANDGPFVALEPWSGLSTCSDEGDVFEEKRGVTLLEAGQSKTVSFTITVIHP